MSIKEFVENFFKERGEKMLPHQKSILKSIVDGKMIYTTSSKEEQKSLLLEAIRQYELSKDKHID